MNNKIKFNFNKSANLVKIKAKIN